MRFLTSIGFSSTSKPATEALPAEGGRKQVRTRIVVVFPAPLGPRKPTIWPFSTSNEMSSTATAWRRHCRSKHDVLAQGRRVHAGCKIGNRALKHVLNQRERGPIREIGRAHV